MCVCLMTKITKEQAWQLGLTSKLLRFYVNHPRQGCERKIIKHNATDTLFEKISKPLVRSNRVIYRYIVPINGIYGGEPLLPRIKKGKGVGAILCSWSFGLFESEENHTIKRVEVVLKLVDHEKHTHVATTKIQALSLHKENPNISLYAALQIGWRQRPKLQVWFSRSWFCYCMPQSWNLDL